jgi:PAS domain S-box-containing protein/putative nucleotidyltransferase with HDIG domain
MAGYFNRPLPFSYIVDVASMLSSYNLEKAYTYSKELLMPEYLVTNETELRFKKLTADGKPYVAHEPAERSPIVVKRNNAALALELTISQLSSDFSFVRTLVDSIPNPIFVAQFDSAIKYVNPSLEKLTGFSRSELLGLKSPYPWWPSEMVQFYEDMNAGGKKIDLNQLERCFRKKNGEHFWVNVKIQALKQGDEAQYFLGIWEDLTEIKQVQEDLQLSLNQTRRALQGYIDATVKMVEMRDPYTAGHQQRVAQLAAAIAGEIGLSPEQEKYIGMAALVHDIGKIYVPAEILSRSGEISDLEFSLMRTHAQGSYNILKTIEFPWPIAQIAWQHHERIDGSGYPNHLKGNEILMEARIIAVADTVEAMTGHRPYRPSLGLERALDEISRNSGKLYDPDAVEACLRLFREKGFTFSGKNPPAAQVKNAVDISGRENNLAGERPGMATDRFF